MRDTAFRLPEPGPEPFTTDPEAGARIAGHPGMRPWARHAARDGNVNFAACGAGDQPREFARLTGRGITITRDGGAPVTLTPGGAFVAEPGFKGARTIKAPARKHFAIMLNQAAPPRR